MKFHLVTNKNFPNNAPEIFCISNFTYPSLYDQRDLFFSIMGKEWKSDYMIENIIDLLPDFINRIHENNINKNFIFYGNYDLNKVYEINNFLLNSELGFFKCFQLMKSYGNNTNEKLNKKERYIILTDIYFMLFDPAPNFKNMGKLIFYGDIRQLNITKTEDYHEDENAHSYILTWKKEDKNILNFQILFCSAFINSNIFINPIQDFIDSVNRKSNKLKENFKVFQEDYKKPISILLNSEDDFDNLLNLSKYFDNKFSLVKNSYIAKNQIILYEIIRNYYLEKKDSKAKEYFSKIKTMKDFKDLDNKIPESYDVIYNITNNYQLSRSYSNIHNENYN